MRRAKVEADLARTSARSRWLSSGSIWEAQPNGFMGLPAVKTDTPLLLTGPVDHQSRRLRFKGILLTQGDRD